MGSDCLSQMASGQDWGCAGSSQPYNAQVSGESTDGQEAKALGVEDGGLGLCPATGQPGRELVQGGQDSRSNRTIGRLGGSVC